MKNTIVTALVCGIVATALNSCLQKVEEDKSSTPSKSGAPADSKESTEGTTSRKSSADKPTSRPAKSTETGEAPLLDEQKYDHFGDKVRVGKDPLTVASLVENVGELKDQKIRLTGTVQSVCKKKGCWMYVAEGDQKVMVQFRDYGFFMPLDCEGRTAVFDGTFSVSETSVADQKHYLEDEGKHEEAKKITKPKVQMKVMADGVALLKKQ